MTEIATGKPSTTDASTTENQDPREAFNQITNFASSVLAELSESALRNPSPCEDYDAGGIAAHLVAVLHRVDAVARGLDPFSVPQAIPGLEPAGFIEAWDRAVEAQRTTWLDDEVLVTPLVLPFATLPGAIALPLYCAEVLVHTWDLAKAINLDVQWDEGLVAGALQTMQFGLPADPRGGEIPFGPVVEVAEDSALIDRLVAWVGRDPR